MVESALRKRGKTLAPLSLKCTKSKARPSNTSWSLMTSALTLISKCLTQAQQAAPPSTITWHVSCRTTRWPWLRATQSCKQMSSWLITRSRSSTEALPFRGQTCGSRALRRQARKYNAMNSYLRPISRSIRRSDCRSEVETQISYCQT